MNQKPPEETEEEKRKKRKLVLNVEQLTFTEWNIHILAVSEKAFKFKSWQLEKFTGKVGMLARECAAGLLNEIIKDFSRKSWTPLQRTSRRSETGCYPLAARWLAAWLRAGT